MEPEICVMNKRLTDSDRELLNAFACIAKYLAVEIAKHIAAETAKQSRAPAPEPTPVDPLDQMRIVLLPEVAKLLGVNMMTLKRNYADKIIRISPRRRGMRVRDIPAINVIQRS